MKKLLIIVLIVSFFPLVLLAGTLAVPRYLNYQSLLYDDGGNLIQDGPADISFKITDALGNVLYEERQTPDVVRGAVSVLIGNGLDANGAPTGGISSSVFLPDSARYLDVQVEGFPPESNLEIVSVPYALYAEKALSVKDESVGSASIAKKSVTMEHLADGLINELASQMAGGGSLATRTDLTNLQTQYRQLSGASTIGVSGNFVYSGNNNVTGVLLDIDRAVQMRQSNINVETTARQTAVTNESNTRSTTDTTLQTNINNEATARVGGDTTLQTNINNEAAARQAADTTESNTRTGADAALQAGINTKVARSGDTMSGVLNMANNLISALAAPVSDNDAARIIDVNAAVGALQGSVDVRADGLDQRVVILEQLRACAGFTRDGRTNCDDIAACNGVNVRAVHYQNRTRNQISELGAVGCGCDDCRFVNVFFQLPLSNIVSANATPYQAHTDEIAPMPYFGSDGVVLSLRNPGGGCGGPADWQVGVSLTVFCR